MALTFLQIGFVALNPDHIETIDNLNGAGTVHVHFDSGNNRSFDGEEADGVRRFFAPVTADPPATEAPKRAKPAKE